MGGTTAWPTTGAVGERLRTGSCGSSAPSRNLGPSRRLRQAPGAGSSSLIILVRYRGTDYSVQRLRRSAIAMLVRGYVHEVVISCAAEVIARHPRSLRASRTSASIRAALSVLAGAKDRNAPDQAAPLADRWLLPPVFGDLRRVLRSADGQMATGSENTSRINCGNRAPSPSTMFEPPYRRWSAA